MDAIVRQSYRLGHTVYVGQLQAGEIDLYKFH